MFTIKDICEKFNLSRSTLLYYHSIGLLSAVQRSGSNYRLYSKEDIRSLERICTYKEAGVPLNEISKILFSGKNCEREILEKTLEMLNFEAKKIKKKQEIIINMLKRGENIMDAMKGINKDLIIESLKLVGVDDEGLKKLHAHLEEVSPEGHTAFLQAMGVPEDEIKVIREAAQKEG